MQTTIKMLSLSAKEAEVIANIKLLAFAMSEATIRNVKPVTDKWADFHIVFDAARATETTLSRACAIAFFTPPKFNSKTRQWVAKYRNEEGRSLVATFDCDDPDKQGKVTFDGTMMNIH